MKVNWSFDIVATANRILEVLSKEGDWLSEKDLKSQIRLPSQFNVVSVPFVFNDAINYLILYEQLETKLDDESKIQYFKILDLSHDWSIMFT